MTNAISSRITGPWVNVAAPNRTQTELLDLKLSQWASLQLHRLKTREIGRYDIEAELRAMEPEKQVRAKHWLNHYRSKKG